MNVGEQMRCGLAFVLWTALSAPGVLAADGPADDGTIETTIETTVEERVQVIGSPDAVDAVPGSAHFIGPEELEKHGHVDIHRVIQRVPGVYFQEEDGYGLRPNIGMRGTGVERSQKITLLEDGVLVAPAPYTAPAAYYFPTVGRMRAVELRKGSSSIRQGPQTNGGVLNLLSREAPDEFGGFANLQVGDDSYRQVDALLGDTAGAMSWMVETFQLRTDGFKRLPSGADTGVELEDYVGKLRWTSSEQARVRQLVELKLGTTQQVGNETYLGLTQSDFDADPYRRYAASERDIIDADHDQFVIRHHVVPREGLDVTTTLYRNDFFRNWNKLQSVQGMGIAAVLDDPATYAGQLAILRGEVDSAAGDLRLRNNRRDYYGQGVQTVLGWRAGNAKVLHRFEFGARWHEDEEDRFQEEDEYQMISGRLLLNALGAPGSQANRVSRARALALFVQDRIAVGRWTLTPGVRVEDIDYERVDYADAARTTPSGLRESSVSEVIPGFGVDYRVSDKVAIFGGVHRGFSPPGAGRNDETQAESSVNYELGTRLAAQHGLTAQFVGFFNDYDNLLGADTLSGSGQGTGDLFNGGRVQVYGAEASVGLAPRVGKGLNLPVRLAYTHTRGEFRSSFTTSFADWAPEVTTGDRLPYVPDSQFFAEVGLKSDRFSAFVSANYVDDMRTTAGQGAVSASEKIEDHVVVDASVRLTVGRSLRLFGNLRNAFDEVYVAARRPAGLRPGLPRTLQVGLSVDF